MVSTSAQQAKEAFGNRLRDLRRDAGLTGRQLAALTGLHVSKVSRAEHANQSLSDADLRAWSAACGADGEAASLIAQARHVESLYREWRRLARTGLRRLQEPRQALCERTRVFRIHEHSAVPGLLQTAAYANESNAYWVQLLGVPDDHEAATGARLALQRVLREGEHRFVFLLAEQVLRYRLSTAEATMEQLDRILAATSLPNVSLGVIASTAGINASTQTAFWIFDDRLVEVETLTAGLEITRPNEIAIYSAVFDQMREAALFGDAAASLVIKARDDLLHCGEAP